MSAGFPNRSTQTRAAFTSSRRFAPVTASSGLPKALPRRVFTSTKVTRSPCRAIRSISVCPTRNRCATMLQPRDRRYRMACSSPAIPRRWRSSVQSEGSVLTPLLTDASYRCADGGRNRNYAGGGLAMRNAECGMRNVRVSVARRSTFHGNSAFRIPHSALSGSADLIQLVQSHQHIPRLRSVRWSQDPCQLQLVDDPRRPAVPDAHAPLEQRRRAELVLDADLGGLAEQGIALAGGALLPLSAAVLPGLRRGLERRHLFIDARARHGRFCGMCLVPVHHPLGLVGRDEGSLHPQ